MAKVLRTIAVVAGAVALIATGIGAIGGAAFAATALGGTIATIGTWAGVVAGVAGIGAQLLTKPPPARGSVTETIIDVNPPSPYGMGEGYFGGVLRHKVGYGPTLKKVPNPFLFEAVALCVAGPIAGPIVPQVDFGPVTSYYSGWLATDTRLGQRPDTALTAPLQANPTGWSSSHRLSSVAAIAWNHRFDKDGKIYASGLPTRGVVAKWALCYDPRKDSTRPGGSGSHRLGIETTYEWSENPALHAGTYAYGRFVNGKRVIGVGLPDEGIDWEGVAAWANDCQANGWRMFGFVFEGAADDAQRRWQNLRDICIAGGGEPLFSGAVLGFHWHRPRVPLDTVTEADLAEGPQEVTAMKSWRDRLNTVRPRYTSPAHNWSLVQAAQVQVASYLAEDGEERAEDIPFNFVKDVNQAAQLAAYWLTNSRELSPITLTLMPRLRNYRPGECLRLQLPELGLDHDAVILRREFDPGSMTVTLTLVTEDPAKHAFALGRTGTAPPTPSLTNSAEDRDTITREARAPYWPEVDGPGRPEDGATNTAPANANRVPFSRFEGGRGWATLGGTFATPGNPVPVIIDNRVYIWLEATADAGGQTVFLGNSPRFPVIPLERLSVSSFIEVRALSGFAASAWQFYIEWLQGSTIVGNSLISSGAGNIFLAPRQADFVEVPSNANNARFVLFAQSGGASTLRLFFLEPMVTSAAPGQTVHPPYAPGPNASDGADPNNLITIDGAGIISGIGTANITVNNAVLPLGNANRVPFSRMEGDRGWIAATNSPGGPTPGYFEFEGRRAISANATATAAGQVITLAAGPGNQGVFPVVPGERLSVSARIGDATNTSGLQINFGYTRANGTYNEIAVVAVGAQGWLAAPVAGFVDVPSDARLGTIRLYAFAAGAGFYNATISEPMVTSAAPGQTVHPPFSPGPNASDGADPNSLITVDGSGVLSGIGTVGIPVDNRNVPLGNANRVPFSRFEGGRGWGIFASSFASNSGLAPLVFQGRTFINVDATASAAGQALFLGNAPTFPVIPGERLSVSSRLDAFALSGQPPSNWSFYIEYRQGTTILNNTIIASGSGNAPSAIGTRHEGFSTVPPGADNAYLVLGVGSSGTGVLRIALLEPMVTSAAASQTVHPPFSPGPNADDGADITAAVSGPGELVLNYNSDDTLASILPVTGSYSLTRAGGPEFTSGVSWAVTVLSGTFSGAAPTIVGSGSAQLRLNSGLSTTEATLRITATLDGRAYPPFAVKVSKVVAPPTSSGGAGSGNNFASDNTLNSFSSGSFVAISNDLTITLPAGVRQASLTASSLELTVAAEAPEGTTDSEFKWQRESSPGVWADVGGIASSFSPNVFNTGLIDGGNNSVYFAEPGSVTCNRTATGLAAGSTQKFRLVARFVSGNLRTTFVSGTVSARA